MKKRKTTDIPVQSLQDAQVNLISQQALECQIIDLEKQLNVVGDELILMTSQNQVFIDENKSHAQDLKEAKESYVQDLKQAEEDHAQDLENVEEDHTQDLEYVEEGHAQDLKEAKESYTQDLKEAEEDHAQELENVEEGHAEDLKEMKESYIQDLREVEESYNQDIKTIEERHRVLVLSTASIIWASDAQSAFTTTAISWGRFTGQSYQQYKGLGWLNAIHPEDVTAFIEGWQEAGQSKSIYQAIIRLHSQHYHDYRYIIMRAVPLLDDSGEIRHWLGSAFDVTELKEKEAILQTNIEHLNLALKSAQVGTWHWDIVKDIMTWDGLIHPIFGRDPGVLKGGYQEFLQLVHENNREQVNLSMQQALTAEHGFTSEYSILWPDGSEHTIATRGETYSNEEGVRLMMSGICWDVTEQRLQEQNRIEILKKAQEYQQMQAEDAKKYRKNLEEFINLICHEIRNPLNGIMGSIEWLKDAQRVLESELSLIGHSSELVEKIQSAQSTIHEVISTNEACAAHQLAVVNDVLDLSKLEANKLILDEVVFAPNQVIDTTAKMLKSSLAAKKLTLKVLLPEKKLIVKGDVTRFKTILINLLTNALKFTDTGGLIVNLEYPSTQAGDITFKMVVEDTGKGMNTEQISHLFERFQQGSRSVYSEFGGSGLGLLICKQLADLMGGGIQVESEVGKGTRFTVTGTFKQVSEQEQQAFNEQAKDHAIAASPSAELAVAKKILIVEDNEINQKVLSSILHKKGYVYAQAHNGLEALDHLKTTAFDLILMDINMPKMNGLEAARRIRKQEKDTFALPTPIIAISGQAQATSIQEALDAGMDDYITKPFNKEIIYDKIAQWTTKQLSDHAVETPELSATSTSFTLQR